jgi:hypothetical protein
MIRIVFSFNYYIYSTMSFELMNSQLQNIITDKSAINYKSIMRIDEKCTTRYVWEIYSILNTNNLVTQSASTPNLQQFPIDTCNTIPSDYFLTVNHVTQDTKTRLYGMMAMWTFLPIDM